MSHFSFARDRVDPVTCRETLGDVSCGAYVSFEGWVRDHNEGRSVQRLEYEAYETLGLKEGERIVAEAMDRFDIVHAGCVHRLGKLQLGELAVWVGVSAHHRDAAFAASRFIIDAVKSRVPIWKKEHYSEGDSGWINCEAGSSDRHPPPVSRSA